MARVLQSWVEAPAAAGVVAWVVSAPVQAEISAVAEAGIGYSDNIGRLPVDEVEETIGTVGLELDWIERSRRVRGDATVDLSYFEYLDNTYDSEVLGTADGRTHVPGRIVDAVDATGAGDCFAGALLARLAAGDAMLDAVKYANAAAALTTTGFGAVAPIPRPADVRAFMASCA